MSFVDEMSKLRSELTELADTIRSKRTELRVLEAKPSVIDQLDDAHTSLKKSIGAWEVAKTAALKSDMDGANQAKTESRRLLTEAKAKLAQVGHESDSANRPSQPAPAKSSPKPKPAPVAPQPPVSSESQEPDEHKPASAGKAESNTPPTLEEIRKELHNCVGDKFGEIDRQFDAVDRRINDLKQDITTNNEINGLFADGEYEVADLEFLLKGARFVRRKSRNDRHNDKKHNKDQDDSSEPPNEVNDIGADQKAAPKNERN